MNDKYIIYFISKTKANMLKFLTNQLTKNQLFDLIPTHGNILTALYEANKPLTLKEITSKIGKDKSTVTILVNKLVKLGYLEKIKDEEDKRNTLIHLTDKALALQPKFNQISQEVYHTAYNNFSEEEKQEFLRLLKKLNKNFSEANRK